MVKILTVVKVVASVTDPGGEEAPALDKTFVLSLDKTFVLFWGAYHAVSLFHTPCKVRKLSSHQRNSKKGSFVHTPLSTTLSISHFHQSKSFSFRFFTVLVL